jgi:hypothetical protein
MFVDWGLCRIVCLLWTGSVVGQCLFHCLIETMSVSQCQIYLPKFCVPKVVLGFVAVHISCWVLANKSTLHYIATLLKSW